MSAGRTASSTESQRFAEQLEQIVLGRIQSQRLAVATMPTVAAGCIQILQDPSWTVQAVTSLLGRDPVLTAQVVRLANSAVYGRGGIRSIEQAVARLGSDKLRTALVELCARQLFQSRNPQIAGACAVLWDHSVGVALLGRDVATLVGCDDDVDTVYLAGLLHDVGKPVIAAMLLEAERTLGAREGGWLGTDSWIEVVQRLHRKVGLALAEAWGLPDAVKDSIRECGDYDVGERKCAANFVRFANAATKLHGVYVGSFDADDAAALLLVGRSILGVDEASTERLLGDLRARIKSQVS